MATKNEIRNVNIVINGKEVTNNIKAIGGEYKKAKAELAKLTIGSDAYVKKASEVKKLKGVLDEHRKTLGFVQTGWQKLGNMIKGALPLLSLGTLVAGTKKLIEFTVALKQNRAEVKKLSELTGPALDNATARVSAIADTYKKDFGEVLQATNNLSKQMGITFAESFDLIEKGFQAGADANGEFLEQVREYPTFFKEAEFSAEQFITQITKQTKSGIFSDKGIDAIKEATLSLREMTLPTREALQALGIDADELSAKIGSGQTKMSDAISMVAQKMSELPAQSQAVGLGLADIFKGAGEDAGVAFISTLADVNTELEDMIDNNNDLVIAQQNNLIATTQWNEALLRLFGEGSEFNKGLASTKAGAGTLTNAFSSVVTNQDLSFWEKLGALTDFTSLSMVAASSQIIEKKEAETQAYDLLNEQLVLQAKNVGILIDLSELNNADIQDLINKKQAQIETERQLAKAEKDRMDEAEKARKKFQAAEEKLQNKIRQIREQLKLDALTEQAREIQAVEFKYAKLEEEAKGHADQLKQIAELRNQEIAAINKKHADITSVKRAEVEAKIQEMLLSGKDKEVAVVAKKYQDLITLAEKFGFDTSDLFTKMQEDIAKITDASDEGNGNIIQKLLGLDDEGWEELNEKFQALGQLVSGAADAYSAYTDLQNNKDQANLQKFEQSQDAKKLKLEKQLESGLITQESFNKQAEKLDEETERKRAEIARKSAEREKSSAIFDASINGLAAAVRFLVDPGGYAGIALAALAGVTAGIQIAAIQAEPIPAFEDGGRIKREGLILAGEGNKEEGILSNAVLTDPELGPLANFLLDKQAGIDVPFPSTAAATSNSGDLSRAVDFNNFQRSGAGFAQSVTNNNTTNTTAQGDNASQQILAEFQRMNAFLSNPINRQAYINYDKQIDSDDEMRYLKDFNEF